MPKNPKLQRHHACQNLRGGFYSRTHNSLPVAGVNSGPLLSVRGLCKRYGAVQALQDVSFEVPAGSVFGLLGPNGSGKTSLLGVVLGILRPSAGDWSWQSGLRRGSLLETPNFYPYLNGEANLRIVAEIRQGGHAQIPSALQTVGLDKYPHLSFQQYSLGMKQRLAIGSALLGDPDIVVLDEPTNGLDPAGIADVRGLIRSASERGHSVLLASHLLDEVEKVCTDVAILQRGRLLACGPLQDVLRDEDTLEMGAPDLALLADLLGRHPLQPRLKQDAEFVSAQFPAGAAAPADINRYCMDNGVVLSHLILRKKTLESRFLELTDPHAAS